MTGIGKGYTSNEKILLSDREIVQASKEQLEKETVLREQIIIFLGFNLAGVTRLRTRWKRPLGSYDGGASSNDR